MIKVVHLQNATRSAGSAALRLNNAFIEEAIDSSILSLMKDAATNTKIKYVSKKSRIISRLDSELKKIITGKTLAQYGSYSYPILGTDVSEIDEIKKADVIYLHWVLGGFLNLSNIEQLAKLKKPVIIFMHDMWWITGGCHHSLTCEKYEIECHNCQVFSANRQNDLSTELFDKKLKLYSKYNNFYFISPSQWLFNCAKNSFLTKNKPVFYIPNYLDSTYYKPFDKEVSKYILNIGTNEIVIAFGAVNLDSPYKGWTYLQEALQLLKNEIELKNATVLIFGKGSDQQLADNIPFKTKFVGYLQDEYSTALVYNAADVFVTSSIAETFGYVIMEALSCGTAVVGFNVGGIPDLIAHKENGYLAKYKDASDLANGIKFCIKNKLKGKLLPMFEKSKIIKKHIDLINMVRRK